MSFFVQLAQMVSTVDGFTFSGSVRDAQGRSGSVRDAQGRSGSVRERQGRSDSQTDGQSAGVCRWVLKTPRVHSDYLALVLLLTCSSPLGANDHVCENQKDPSGRVCPLRSLVYSY